MYDCTTVHLAACDNVQQCTTVPIVQDAQSNVHCLTLTMSYDLQCHDTTVHCTMFQLPACLTCSKVFIVELVQALCTTDLGKQGLCVEASESRSLSGPIISFFWGAAGGVGGQIVLWL